MDHTEVFLLVFAIINLCLVIFCRPLSLLVLSFFTFGRSANPPEELNIKAGKLGFKGVFSNTAFTKPTRKQAVIFLVGTGLLNFLGCVGFYLISIGIFEESKGRRSLKDNEIHPELTKPRQSNLNEIPNKMKHTIRYPRWGRISIKFV